MKNSRNETQKNDFSKLRHTAEKFLEDNASANVSYSEKDIKLLFQELQVQQIELEMQNDELRLINVELERQRFRFSGIYDYAPIGYLLLDRAGVIKDVNNTGVSLLEGAKKDIAGKRMQTFVDTGDHDVYYNFFMHMLRTRARQRCELKIRSFQGKNIHAQIEGIALNSIENEIECYIAIVDISDRVNAQEELAAIKERLELSMEASLAGTWELDLKNMRFFLDESSQRICSLPKNHNRHEYSEFISLIHPDDRKEADRQFRTSINSGREIDITCRFAVAYDRECYTVIRGHSISASHPEERLVGIIMDITEKTLMEKNARLLNAEHQKKIALATLNTEENERKRISGALHDSVSQLLYAVKMQLGQLDNMKRPQKSEINSINRLLEEAIEETRNISFELAPSILTDFGLAATIEELAQRLSSKNLKIIADVSGFYKRIDLLLETNIYRIIQELINNSLRHGEASLINIELHNKELIEIVVRDNGRGFSLKDQENLPHGSGLFSIKNRLSLYNGSMHIHSEPGVGTIVEVKLDTNYSGDRISSL